ncbi:MAG: single-stranded DNA-binding protein [Cyanothece sp. SIO1E1]|nr:single-stranded DNA-binding protein [Cyanothece sp. SIO1E1]
MFKFSLIGRIGADAEVRYHNGQQAISFPIAHNEKYKDKGGIKHEKTTWVNCTIWRGKDNTLAKHLKKGMQLYLEGSPGFNIYKTKHGESAISVSMRVKEFSYIDGGKKDESKEQEKASKPVANGTATSEGDDSWYEK